MTPTEYEHLDGLALAGLLHSGQVSAPEIMICALHLAEMRNPVLNALCEVLAEQAMDAARQARPKGQFGALPFLLKDSGLAAEDLPSSVGSRLFLGQMAAADATLTTRFRAAGLLPFGRTTVPEFCMAPTTEAAVYGGPTRNPWALDRSSGGSSGGAAAAVAAGIVPLAHGSDGGGSIRIPASCCGVFGMKPSRGLVPHGPLRGEGWGGLAVDGVISRSVRDTAAALDAISGMEPGQPYAAPARPESYLAGLHEPFARPLRIAKWTKTWDDIPIAPECLEAVGKASDLLTGLGHEVVEAALPDLKYASFVQAITQVMAANVTVTVNGFLRRTPKTDLTQMLEPAILDAYHIGQSLTAEEYVLAITRFHAIGRLLDNILTDFDVLLTPTLTQLPLKLGTLTMQDGFRDFRRKAGAYTTFLAIINASGQPAASLPLHWTEAGIPVGVQLVTRFGADADLLRLSAQLEQAAPWSGRRPVFG